MIFVKPKDGAAVPDPDRGGFLPTAGRSVPLSQYWLRRLADGDVVEAATGSGKRGEK